MDRRSGTAKDRAGLAGIPLELGGTRVCSPSHLLQTNARLSCGNPCLNLGTEGNIPDSSPPIRYRCFSREPPTRATTRRSPSPGAPPCWMQGNANIKKGTLFIGSILGAFFLLASLISAVAVPALSDLQALGAQSPTGAATNTTAPCSGLNQLLLLCSTTPTTTPGSSTTPTTACNSWAELFGLCTPTTTTTTSTTTTTTTRPPTTTTTSTNPSHHDHHIDHDAPSWLQRRHRFPAGRHRPVRPGRAPSTTNSMDPPWTPPSGRRR